VVVSITLAMVIRCYIHFILSMCSSSCDVVAGQLPDVVARFSYFSKVVGLAKAADFRVATPYT